MHVISNNPEWLRSSQQLEVSLAGFKTPQIEKIVTKSPIYSRIGFSYLWVIIRPYLIGFELNQLTRLTRREYDHLEPRTWCGFKNRR
jgi:hypothetical protein